MADGTAIGWTDATWNVITGCSVASPACTHCYAMKLAGGRLRHHPSRVGLTTMTRAGPVWNGQVRFNEKWLTQPLHWRRPRMIFVCAHGDLFHEAVPDEWLDRVFAVMALCPQHTFQVLTKRAERMRAYLRDGDRIQEIRWRCVDIDNERWCGQHGGTWPLPNVWLGVSIEDQTRADERVPILLDTPAAVRWVSAEPLLGPIDLTTAWHSENALDSECWGECKWCAIGNPPLHNCRLKPSMFAGERSGLDWVVVGGESGTRARPMHPDWARGLRDQCTASGVAFNFKQWGEWIEFYDRDRDDPDWRNPPRCDNQMGRGAERYHNLAGGLGFHGERVIAMRNVGKQAAGRVLDGRIWDEYPEAAP